MPITHAFTNPKSDGGDTTVVRPSDWNADHIGSAITTYDLSPTADTYIAEDASSTNYESDDELLIADRIATFGGYTKQALLEFDISGLSGTVVRADLMMFGIGTGNGGIFTGHLGVRKVVRSSVVLSQATWSVYSTGNNWGSAGARNASDVAQQFEATVMWSSPSNQAGGWLTFDLTGMVRRAIMDSVTDLQVIVGSIDVATGSQNALVFASQEWSVSAERPILSVLGA